jgi:hypothetical protein
MTLMFTARPVTAASARRWLTLVVVGALCAATVVASEDAASAVDPSLQSFDEVCSEKVTEPYPTVSVKATGAHARAIDCLARYGIIHSPDDGPFRPQSTLTRGQLATLLSRFIQVARPDHRHTSVESSFRDIQSSRHRESIVFLESMGVATGLSATGYGPDAAATRGQKALFLHRTLTMLGISFDDTQRSSFRDVPSGSAQADAIELLAAAGIVDGAPNRFAPDRELDRQQAAAFLLRSALALHAKGLWGPTAVNVPPGTTEPPSHDDHSTPDPGAPDPGHDHGTPEPGHDHGTPDPGHDHGTPDPGHDHGKPDLGHDHGSPDPGTGEPTPTPSDPVAAGRWTAPSTWPSGAVPSASTDVVIDRHVVVDGAVTAATVRIVPGGILEFDPARSSRLEVRGNVTVEGELRMRPASADHEHVLRFVGIDETKFVGGHTDRPVASDVGLWVVGDGKLNLHGTPREAWNRTGVSPTWRPDDELRLTPTAAGDFSTFRRFTARETVPAVSGPAGAQRAEILNLTRNVRIEGTGDGTAHPRSNGRAHVMIIGNQPQTIRYVELRHMGPRKEHEGFTRGVDGRYPLHVHRMGNRAQGTLIEGVVVRNSGHRAFVVHASHGVTLRDTISYDTFDEAYWWDPDSNQSYPANASHDVRYERAVAALVRSDPDFRGYHLAGFWLGQGERNACVECVAVGVLGNNSAGGFVWAEQHNEKPNVWEFVDSVAHNNRVSGIRIWQNDPKIHEITRFTGYRNGEIGIDHGAYGNRYQFLDNLLFENGTAVLAHVPGGSSWRNMQATATGSIVRITSHVGRGEEPTLFLGGSWKAPTAVRVMESVKDQRGRYDFVNIEFNGRELQPSDFSIQTIHPETRLRVQRSDGTAFQITAEGTTIIPRFHPR